MFPSIDFHHSINSIEVARLRARDGCRPARAGSGLRRLAIGLGLHWAARRLRGGGGGCWEQGCSGPAILDAPPHRLRPLPTWGCTRTPGGGGWQPRPPQHRARKIFTHRNMGRPYGGRFTVRGCSIGGVSRAPSNVLTQHSRSVSSLYQCRFRSFEAARQPP